MLPAHRNNYKWTTPVAGVPQSVGGWLAAAGLEDYAEKFRANGYDEVSLLQGLSMVEIDELAAAVGMRPGHLLKLRRRCLPQAAKL